MYVSPFLQKSVSTEDVPLVSSLIEQERNGQGGASSTFEKGGEKVEGRRRERRVNNLIMTSLFLNIVLTLYEHCCRPLFSLPSLQLAFGRSPRKDMALPALDQTAAMAIATQWYAVYDIQCATRANTWRLEKRRKPKGKKEERRKKIANGAHCYNFELLRLGLQASSPFSFHFVWVAYRVFVIDRCVTSKERDTRGGKKGKGRERGEEKDSRKKARGLCEKNFSLLKLFVIFASTSLPL
jgi:hypothetical protein